jgi:hypothetical protein
MLFLTILICCLLVQLFAPWYFIAPIAFIASLLLGRTARSVFLQALGAVGVLWGGAALYFHLAGDGIITNRMAGMFGLPLAEMIIPITMLLGGLVAGIAALTGYYTQKVIKRDTWQFR